MNIRSKLAAGLSSPFTVRRFVVAALCFLLVSPALAQVARAAVPTAPTLADVVGEIERVTVDNPADVWSGGTVVVGGQNIIVPRKLLMDFPASRPTLQQLFEQAPQACVGRAETGLAETDGCNTSGAGGIATITANRTAAGLVVAPMPMLWNGMSTPFADFLAPGFGRDEPEVRRQ